MLGGFRRSLSYFVKPVLCLSCLRKFHGRQGAARPRPLRARHYRPLQTHRAPGFWSSGGPGRRPCFSKECARSARFVVAADSGLDSCVAAGVVPDLVVGDMDSLSDPSLLNGFAADRILLFPRDKDETDTEIGLRILHERGWGAVTIAGGAGEGSITCSAWPGCSKEIALPCAGSPAARISSLSPGEAEFLGWAGGTVSVFPVGDRAAVPALGRAEVAA